MPTALITGISGQDGSYLTDLLLERRYRVVGLSRDPERAAAGHLRAVASRLGLHAGGLDDLDGLVKLVREVQPDEIYNLAGQTHVGASWEDAPGTLDSSGTGVCRMLEAMRHAAPAARFFQASSCDMFDARCEGPLNEESPMRPASPYGAAKRLGHDLVRLYREQFGFFCVAGILFNHESPRRPESFVTRRITKGVARIARGQERELHLGNLDARRDWGFAGDYVLAMWMMLQQETPQDLVIGTGVAHSVREFCDAAFAAAGLRAADHVVSDPSRIRKSDAPVRLADPTRARSRLGWSARVDFQSLVRMMVEADLHAA